MYDTIIIGAGMSGLAAGIRLAHFGQRVCILERHHAIGGLNSFYRQRGRRFDVGLHALTNYTPKGARQGPLARLLRQLRVTWDDWSLVPQRGSAIVFPGVTLEFSNDFEQFAANVARQFPGQEPKLRRLVATLGTYEQLGEQAVSESARRVVASMIDEPMLREMLFCPVLFYGGAREHDIDFGQFSILFRSIFLEGLGRPVAGIQTVLKKLADRFRDLGGELRLRAGVQRIVVKDGRVQHVELEDGTELPAKYVLSSAGWPETMRLCNLPDAYGAVEPGNISFVESISVLNTQPASLGHQRTMVFFNETETFDYRRPDDLVDLRSGLICSPNNFVYDEPPGEGMVRVSALANYKRWAALGQEEYRQSKLAWYDKLSAAAVRHVPDFRSAVIETDMFTPTTIRRFTGRENGAIYGAPQKHYDGRTPVDNLYICGADQGLVGIVGTLISGIAIANRYLLRT
ncbi:MAG: NAD(P)/FAD-dependent oxidoreductase [Patescibacteria group bacterium]|nr:NAD(P)/FAD-dependent oxidoreductase [Patescibacteria group bacterium]